MRLNYVSINNPGFASSSDAMGTQVETSPSCAHSTIYLRKIANDLCICMCSGGSSQTGRSRTGQTGETRQTKPCMAAWQHGLACARSVAKCMNGHDFVPF